MSFLEEEIDLRPYILTLSRRWWQIVLLALITAAVAFISGVRQPRTYTSTTTILLTRSRANLLLAEQFPTVTEPIDARSRMDALLAIARSDAIAQETIKSLGDTLAPGERQLDAFKNRVAISNNGDLILVTASSGISEQAAKIANAWAEQAVRAINRAYSGELPLDEVQSQLKTSKQEYENAQSDLEDFIQNNQINILQRRLDEARAVFAGMANDRAMQYNYYYNRKQAMVDIRIQAEALQQQLANGSQSTAAGIGDALAVLRARATAFDFAPMQVEPLNTSSTTGENINQGPNQQNIPAGNSDFSLDINLSEVTALGDTTNNYEQDLTRLIQQAETEERKAEENLQRIVQDVLKSEDLGSMEETAAQIRTVETQLESEQSQQRKLASSRDLAWKAYQAFAQKEVEIKNTSQTNNQVNVASMAIPSQKPASRGVIKKTITGGLMGIVIGVVWVLLVQWWKLFNQPSRARSPLSATELGNK